MLINFYCSLSLSVRIGLLKLTQDVADQSILAALKCDLRDDRNVRERLARYNKTTVQYEEGLAVARRIRASRYLGVSTIFYHDLPTQYHVPVPLAECSSKHNRGVTEVFYEAARVSLSTRAKGSGEGCIVM